MTDILPLVQYFAHLGRLFILGPRSEDAHGTLFSWLLSALRILLFLLVTRRYIAPFILGKLSKRVRVRSISLRSIRGLYFRHGDLVLTLDRIGLSFQRPTKERPRRCAVKVEGLRLSILHDPAAKHVAAVRRTQAIHKRISSLFVRRPQPVVAHRASWRVSLLLPLQWIAKLTESWWRPILRGLFVSGFRAVIRLLPALTQVLEFEMDTAIITFDALRGAHIRLSGMTLSSRVTFEDLEHVIHGATDEGPFALGFGSLAGFRARAERLWERGWGNTRGAAAISVTLQQVFGSTNAPATPPHAFTQPPIGTFLAIHSPIDLKAALRFNPKLARIEDHSLDTTLDLAHIEIMADVLQTLIDLVEEAQMSNPSSPTDYLDATSNFSPPVSPLVGVWTEMTSASREPSRATSRKGASKAKRFVPLVSNIRVGFQSISASLRHASSGHLYKLSLDSLALQASLSEPRTNTLHQKWLGSVPPDGCSEGKVLSFIGDLRTISLRRSNDLGIQDNWMTLLSVTRIHLRALATEAALQLRSVDAIFTEHVTSAFVACELVIDDVEVTERLDAINESLSQASANVTAPKPASTPGEAVLPHIQFDMVLRDLRLHLIRTPEDALDHEIGVHVQSNAIEIHTEAKFHKPMTDHVFSGPNKPVTSATGPGIPELDFHFTFVTVVEPIFARASISDTRLSHNSHEEPFFLLDRVELVARGEAPASLKEEALPYIDLSAVMADVSLSTPSVSLDLWNRDRVKALTTFATSFRPAPPQARVEGQSKSLFSALMHGVNARLTISEVLLTVTGRDLNPNCDLELARGLSLKTSLSVAYCLMHTEQHFERTKYQRHKLASDRMRLGLQEDILVQAVAKSRARSSVDDQIALVALRIGRTSCQVAIATDVDGEQADQFNAPEQHMVDGPVIFSIPEPTVGRFTLQRTHQRNFFNNSHHTDLCDAMITVPLLRVTYNLRNVYCALLAGNTLNNLVPKRPVSHPTAKKGGMQLLLTAKVETLDIFCGFTEDVRLFVRIDALLFQQSPKYQRVGFRQLKAYVPHVDVPLVKRNQDEAHASDTWDELIQIKTLTTGPNETPIYGRHVEVSGESLRLKVPSGYKLADLIFQASLAVKTIKHLLHIIPAGTYSDIDFPEAEPAKHVPVIVIRFESVLIDAEDLPFERNLNLIYQAGFDAQRVRIERELAFDAKCAAITRETPPDALLGLERGKQRFTSKHTVSIEAARERLNLLHSNSWISSFNNRRNEELRREEQLDRRFRTPNSAGDRALPISRRLSDNFVPLLRIQLSGLQVHISKPSFELSDLPSFMYDVGSGVPRDTQFSLLVPLHLKTSFMRGGAQIRDYAVPLLYVPQHSEPVAAFELDTDLVIAEEMGSSSSVKWVDCEVLPKGSGILGAGAMSFRVPKTAMPVKTYARPAIKVTTRDTTHVGWGISYMPAIQEVMRFVDSLTQEPDDPSDRVGFWDKLRLVFLWQLRVHFAGPVQINLKGSCDPHSAVGPGAGFAFCWQGGTEIVVGYPNNERELVQITGDSMQLIIPDIPASLPSLYALRPTGSAEHGGALGSRQKGDQKVCARFNSGIRMGLGFVFERSCAPKCKTCPEDPFYRRCRFFDFRPHYQVQLRSKQSVNTPERDSFEGFRSDFIHMSFSLTSPARPGDGQQKSNNVYLSPLTFQHFWRWWDLFNSTMTRPVRSWREHNCLFDVHPGSKKFGRSLATIKYRFSVEKLFITHVYKSDTRTSWKQGETPFIGIKGFMERLEADLHQAAQEATILHAGKPAVVTHVKRFSAASVVLSGLELRLLAAVFADPNKQLIALREETSKSPEPWSDMEPYDNRSRWVDMDDFVEVLWNSVDKKPRIYLSHLASCPTFTYSKHGTWIEPWNVGEKPQRGGSVSSISKFGKEDTHLCLLGHHHEAKEIQLNLARRRKEELQQELEFFLSGREADSNSPTSSSLGSESLNFDEDDIDRHEQDYKRRIDLLAAYITQLEAPAGGEAHSFYYVPAETVDSSAWDEFDNVYQIHCPNIVFNNDNRNLLYAYYLASTRHRGFDFHLATRAVKFIQDMAHEDAEPAGPSGEDASKRQWAAVGGAAAAVDAFRSLLAGDRPSESELERKTEPFHPSDPLLGWGDDAGLSKSHYGIVFKAQVVMQSDKLEDACLVVTASDVSMQNFRILDLHNQDDPVTGHIMNRNHAAVRGLQVFSPTGTVPRAVGRMSHVVPLEVLVDYRCESDDFDRLVPPTEASLHYDKINRSRPRASASTYIPQHVAQQTDLVVVHMPRFSVTAKCRNFQTISSVVTDLLLFSDPAHHSRVERLETFLFSYDFADLDGAANLIRELQLRIRQLCQVERGYALRYNVLDATEQLDLLSISAQIFVLADELSLVFDAIGAAQAQSTDLHDDQLGLRLIASSQEISWNMLDDRTELLAKLVLSGIHFNWLNKQDSSTSSQLIVSDLRALHSSPTAIWPEILVKHDHPANHHMVKRKVFLDAEWRVLPPVGGITIFENFQLELHPMRLQVESEVGTKILDYFWPTRKLDHNALPAESEDLSSSTLSRSTGSTGGGLLIPERGLARSRSQTNLRDQNRLTLHRFKSSTNLNDANDADKDPEARTAILRRNRRQLKQNDASTMRARSSTKTFIRVCVPKVHVLLSAKTDDFFCNEASVSTREQKWLNETTSFEELVGKFIPSDPTWKDWVKIALTQKVIPVLPVAKELFSKTKWGSKAAASQKNFLYPSESQSGTPDDRPRHARKRSRGNADQLPESSITPRIARSRSRDVPRVAEDRRPPESEATRSSADRHFLSP